MENHSVLLSIESTPPRLRFWETSGGLKARQYLEGYGAVVHERRLTKDITAIPAPDGLLTGGSRSAPSSLPDVETVYLSVWSFLKHHGTARWIELVHFIYDLGLNWEERLEYVYADGSGSVILPAGEPAPEVPIALVRSHCTKAYRYEFVEFECPPLDAFCRDWGLLRRRELERMHERIGRTLARELGL